MSTLFAVSYTHLDVYKRQEQSVFLNCKNLEEAEYHGKVIEGFTFANCTNLKKLIIGPEAVSYTHLDVYKRQGIYTGWMNDIADGLKTSVTGWDWAGLLMISFILPAILCPLINMFIRKLGWVKDGDMTLS